MSYDSASARSVGKSIASVARGPICMLTPNGKSKARPAACVCAWGGNASPGPKKLSGPLPVIAYRTPATTRATSPLSMGFPSSRPAMGILLGALLREHRLQVIEHTGVGWSTPADPAEHLGD